MAQLNIDKLLKKYGLTQKDLAECTGINKNTISKYCNNTFENINKTHIDLICKLFDCSPNDLFEIDTTVEVKNPDTIIYDDETDKFELSNKSIKELKCILNNYKNSKENKFTPYINYEPIDINNIKPINKYEKNSAIGDLQKVIFNTWKNSFLDIPNENNKTEIKSSNKTYYKTTRKVLEQQAKRLDLEHDFEKSVNDLLDRIIDSYDPTIQEHYKELLETYSDSKDFPLSFKLTTLYRVVYRLLSIQSDSGLCDFITKLRNIYMNGDLIDLTDDELKQLYDISNYYMNSLNNKEND